MEQAAVRQPVREEAVKVGTPPEQTHSLQDLYEMISQRAYELFEARAYEHGHDLDDWLRAEAELLHPVHPKIHHTVNTITVRAELPGFRADQIQVSVEPWRMTLTGKKESDESKKTARDTITERRLGQVFRLLELLTEGPLEHVFRVVELPVEIEPSKVTAWLRDDVLEVVLPKVEKLEANLKLKAARQEPAALPLARS